jgi:CRP/FNR family transcriptional regulator
MATFSLPGWSGNPRFLDAIEKNGEIRTLPANHVLLREGDRIRSIPIVKKGSIKVSRHDEEGREILLYYIRPGESCVMSFLAGSCQGRSSVEATTEEETEIIFVSLSSAGEWIREFPEWSEFIFKLYQQRFEELLGVINAIAFQKMDERLIAYLEKKQELRQNSEINITHEQIAQELGTSRVVVSRLLKQLEQNGKVKLGRNRLRLLS